MPAEAVLLDANLLVLLAVGAASPSYIARHKRLRAYATGDFDLLVDILSRASRVVVTPNTVTEASNLAAYIAEPARTHIYMTLRALLEDMVETYIESRQAVRHEAFVRLGVTDSVLLNIVADGGNLLTADLDLYLEAIRRGHAATNFNHLIEANQ